MDQTQNDGKPAHHGSLTLGLLVCWLLNAVHLGVAYLFFAYGEQTLPTVFALVGGIGLLQVGYIAPIWFVLRRRGRKRMAKGLFIGAVITAAVNAGFIFLIYLNS